MTKKPKEGRTPAQLIQAEAERDVLRQISEASAGSEAKDLQLSARIRKLVDLFTNHTEAAEVAGRSTDAVGNWVSGKTVPAFDVLARMAHSKNVSLEWLASGKGAMLAGELVPAGVVADFSYIPRYAVRAGAGSGQLVESENLLGFLAFRTDWIRTRLRRNPANLAVLEAYGDSMHPTIADGDIMLVDLSEERVRGPAIYVILAGNEAIVKRIELTLEGWLVVKSDNPAYETRTLKDEQAEDFRCIGKVIWSGGMI